MSLSSKLCLSKKLARVIAGIAIVGVIVLLFSYASSSSSLRGTNSRAMYLYDETICDYTKPPQGTYKQNCGACKPDNTCKSPLLPYTNPSNSLCYCVTTLTGGGGITPTVVASQPTVVAQPTTAPSNDAWGLLSYCGTQERMGNCNDGLFCTLGDSRLELSPEQQQCVTYEAGGNNISGKITVNFAGQTEDINLNNGVSNTSSPARTYNLPFPQDVTVVPKLYAWWKATFFSCDGGTTFRLFEGTTFSGCLSGADDNVKTKTIILLAKIFPKKDYYDKFKTDNSIIVLGQGVDAGKSVKTYTKSEVGKMIGTTP
ncbi:hypothetical protein COY90_01315, partial [Candidatus Roizmanbacteria bacterium CG_4_10_14_0_8_um_filter_39_9]